jgi:hypothetical protein
MIKEVEDERSVQFQNEMGSRNITDAEHEFCVQFQNETGSMETITEIEDELHAQFQNETGSMETITEIDDELHDQFQDETGSMETITEIDDELHAQFQNETGSMNITEGEDEFCAQFQSEVRTEQALGVRAYTVSPGEMVEATGVKGKADPISHKRAGLAPPKHLIVATAKVDSLSNLCHRPRKSSVRIWSQKKDYSKIPAKVNSRWRQNESALRSRDTVMSQRVNVSEV